MLPGPVCVSLAPATVAEIFDARLDGADCVEARLDYLDDPEEARQTRWSDLPLPVIATCRRRERGGRFAGTQEDEMQVLERAVENGARFVDLDFRNARPMAPAEVIGSYHDFERTPDGLEALLVDICEAPGAIAKLATMVRSWEDNRRLMDLLTRRWPKPVIVVGMGPIGEVTRVVGPARGSALTYASRGRASAPGQTSVDELLGTYRFRGIGPSTRLVGIVGQPVAHSLSPELHNRAFGRSGLDFVYLKFPVDDVGEFFAEAERLGIVGFSVMIPHKVTVMRFLDEITPEARATGAVNTVWREAGRWHGDNTDVHGVRTALAGIDLEGRNVAVIGTGGAARAAVAALPASARITVASRTRGPGALDWSRTVAVERIAEVERREVDLLINATPAGMAPNVDAKPLGRPARAGIVFDMVYNPARTRLLAEAEAEGRRTIPGTSMFLAQAARQFEIWTGRPAPAGLFDRLP